MPTNNDRDMAQQIRYLDPFQSLKDATALAIGDADIGTYGPLSDVAFVLGGQYGHGRSFRADIDAIIEDIDTNVMDPRIPGCLVW